MQRALTRFCAFSQRAAENEFEPICDPSKMSLMLKKTTFFIDRKKTMFTFAHIIKAAMFVYEGWSIPQCPGLFLFKMTPPFSLCLCKLALLESYLHVMSRSSSTSHCHFATVRRIMEFRPFFRSAVHFLSFFPDFKGPTWEKLQNVKHSRFFFQPSQSKSWQKVPLQLFVLKVVLFTVKRIL